MQLSISGLADKEVAAKLGLSIDTIKTYWKRIRQKSRGRTRPEIVATFVQKHSHDQLQASRREVERLLSEVQRYRKEENQLRTEADEKVRAVSEASFDLVAVLRQDARQEGQETDFRIEYANSRIASFLQRTRDYLVGRKLADVVPEPMLGAVRSRLDAAAKGNEAAESDLMIEKPGHIATRMIIRVVPMPEGAVVAAKLDRH